MNDYPDVPADVLREITESAQTTWADDPEMIQYITDAEVVAFHAFTAFDFNELAQHRQKLLLLAHEWGDTWEERLATLEIEADALRELGRPIDGIPEDVVSSIRDMCRGEHPDHYSMQWEGVQAAVDGWRYAQQLRESLGPITGLLIEMEQIIGGACFNHSIQNYGPGGVWEGEGRAFRYPITTIEADRSERKRWTIPGDTPAEVLATGYYKFGANELGIMRALVDVVRMIESKYGVDLSDERQQGG